MVGATSTATHYLIAIAVVQYVSVYAANLVGYLAAVAVSYFGHQRYSFQLPKSEISHRAQLPKFLLASLGGLVLSSLILATMESVLQTPHWLSLATTVCLVPIYTFMVNKFCVFRANGRG